MAATDFRADRGDGDKRPPSTATGGKKRPSGPFAFGGRAPFWLMAASAWGALTIASLIATLIPVLAVAGGTRFFVLAALSGVAAAGCAFVAAALQMSEFARAARALSGERADGLVSVSPAEAREMDGTVDAFSRNLLVEHPMRIAASLEIASRAIDAQTESMRVQLQSVADQMASALEAQTQSFAAKLGEEQGKLEQALDLYGETIGSRLKLASVGLAREFRDNADQLQKRVQSAGESAVGSLERQGEAIVRALSDSAEEIERRIALVSHDTLSRIETASAAAVEAVEIQSGTAARRFVETTHALAGEVSNAFSAEVDKAEQSRLGLVSVLDESAGALSERVDSATRSVENAIAHATALMDRHVEDALSRIETRIDGRVSAMEAKILEIDSSLDSRGEGRRDAIVAEFAAATGAMNEAVATVTAEVGRAVASEAERVRGSFAEGSRASLQEWLTLAEAAADKLERASSAAADAAAGVDARVTDRLTTLEAALIARGDHLAQSLTDQAQALSLSLERSAGVFSGRGEAFTETLNRTVGELNAAAGIHLRELEARLEGWRREWEEARNHQAALWNERAAIDGARLSDASQAHRDSVVAALDAHQRSMEASFAAALSSLGKESTERDRVAAERLGEIAKDVVEGLLTEMNGLTVDLGTRGALLRDQFAAHRTELGAALAEALAQTEGQTNERLRHVSDTLEGLAARIDGGLEARGQNIAQTLARAVLEITQSFANGLRDARAEIDTGANEALQRLEAGRANLVETLTRTVRDGGATLDEGLNRHRESLENGASEAAERVAAVRATLAHALSETVTDALGRLDGALRETVGVFDGGSNEAVARLAEGRKRLVEGLADAASESIAALAERGAAAREALATEASRAAQLLETSRAAADLAAQRLAAEVGKQQAGLDATVQRAVARIREEIGTPLEGVLQKIETEGAQLAAATRQLAESLSVSSSRERATLHETFAREAEALASTIAANAENFRHEFEGAVSGADDVFLARGMDLARVLVNRITELKELLSGEGFGLLSALDTSSANLSQQIESASHRSLQDFERKATSLIGLLTRRGDDLLSAMAAATSESVRKVTGLSSDIDASTEQTNNVLREIERRMAQMLTTIEKRSTDVAMGGRRPAGGDDAPGARSAPESSAPRPTYAGRS